MILRICGIRRKPDVFIIADLVHEVFIVGIDEDKAILTGTEKIIEFALGLDDTLERTKALQMGAPHVGYQATGRLSRLNKRLDVAWMTGTHFDDGNLMRLRQTEERLGHSHVIIEITLCVKHLIFL